MRFAHLCYWIKSSKFTLFKKGNHDVWRSISVSHSTDHFNSYAIQSNRSFSNSSTINWFCDFIEYTQFKSTRKTLDFNYSETNKKLLINLCWWGMQSQVGSAIIRTHSKRIQILNLKNSSSVTVATLARDKQTYRYSTFIRITWKGYRFFYWAQ